MPSAEGEDVFPVGEEAVVVCDDDGAQPTGVPITPRRPSHWRGGCKSIQRDPPAPARPSNWAPPAPERPPAELPPMTARLGEPEGERPPMTARGCRGHRAETATAPRAPRGRRRSSGRGAVAEVFATGGGDDDPWALPDVPLETLVAVDSVVLDDEVSDGRPEQPRSAKVVFPDSRGVEQIITRL